MRRHDAAFRCITGMLDRIRMNEEPGAAMHVIPGIRRQPHSDRPQFWAVAGEVAEVSTGPAVVESGIELRPDVSIIDLSTAGGLEAAQKLLKAVPRIRVVRMTTYAGRSVLRLLRQSGVHAYIL